MSSESSQQIGHTDAAELYKRVQAGEDIQVLDVREPWEHAQGVIGGAFLMPLAHLRERWRELDGTRPITVICHLGARSAMAARFLAQQGLSAENVDDGMAGWEGHGYPVLT
jgi:rhodanese-related sulfurtransferase